MSSLSNLSVGSKRPYLLIRPLDRAQTFTQDVFLRVAMEWLLSCEDVLSVEFEYRLKRSIPFDQTVGSRSNFYRGCFPWIAVEWLLGGEDVWSVELEYLLKRAILLIRPLDRAQTFTEAVFLRVAMERLLGDEDVWSVELDNLVKRAIPFDPTVRSCSNFYRGCFP